MSTPAQKANLARIRDNQRRSRARRREYIQELEQRLRAFELQGVEASAEVQMAARRVAEENRQLRELLNKHGFGDDYIAQYLQVGTAAHPDPSSGHRFHTGDPGSSVQSLQNVIAPRRPVGLETSLPFPLPTQVTRELSSTSISAGSSSSWEHQHAVMPTFGHPQAVNVAPQPVAQPAPAPPPPPHPYPSSVFTEGPSQPRQAPFPQVSPSGPMLEDMGQQSGSTQATINESSSAINYNVPLNTYQNPTTRDYSSSGGFY